MIDGPRQHFVVRQSLSDISMKDLFPDEGYGMRNKNVTGFSILFEMFLSKCAVCALVTWLNCFLNPEQCKETNTELLNVICEFSVFED